MPIDADTSNDEIFWGHEPVGSPMQLQQTKENFMQRKTQGRTNLGNVDQIENIEASSML
jgi:hypothetical protein